MNPKQSLLRAARAIVPMRLRARMRGVPAVRWMMQKATSGQTSRPYPGTPYTFYLEGYRNIGFVSGDLDGLEREERDWATQWLKQHPAEVIWDVGANIGFWTLHLAACCPAAREIRCFEPDAENLAQLQRNRDHNALEKVVVRPVGLSDNVGTATFYTDPISGRTGSLEAAHDFVGRRFGSRRGETTIELTTMDAEVDAGAAVPQFLKIDVEGHELAFFQGGARTLRAHRPAMIFESSANQEATAKLLHELGYRLMNLEGREIELPEFSTVAVPR